ncbi:MAG: GTPase Era [Lachnospiraceae bacterium]|nr:GTPase Era [Lachnospiraceae bacterium]
MGRHFKSGFVTLIGRPNVGKSTLMNHLIGQKIAITSRKPQTTRNRIQTVYTDKESQMIFLDTPGIHKAKNKLGEYMVNVAERTLTEVDVILWLVEPDEKIGPGDSIILEKLKNVKTPVILIINKIDTIDKAAVGGLITMWKKQHAFKAVIPVSALRSVNTDTVLEEIRRYLPEGPMYYDEDTVTDQPIRQITAEIIREKALRRLEDEIPHGIAVTVDVMKVRKDGIWQVDASIICERDSHKGIIIGKQGSMLKSIGIDARKDIELLTGGQVNLKLWVKVRKEWRDSDIQLKNFGYFENK